MITHRLLTLFCLASSSISLGMLVELPSYTQAIEPEVAPPSYTQATSAQKPLFSTAYDRTLGNKKRAPLANITNAREEEFKKPAPREPRKVPSAQQQEDPKAIAKREYLAKKEIALKNSITELEADLKMMNAQRFLKKTLFQATKKYFMHMRSQAKDVETRNQLKEKIDALDIEIDHFAETIGSLENLIIKAQRRLACACTKTGEQCDQCDAMNLKDLDRD